MRRLMGNRATPSVPDYLSDVACMWRCLGADGPHGNKIQKTELRDRNTQPRGCQDCLWRKTGPHLLYLTISVILSLVDAKTACGGKPGLSHTTESASKREPCRCGDFRLTALTGWPGSPQFCKDSRSDLSG
jgi:hypothetical protein